MAGPHSGRAALSTGMSQRAEGRRRRHTLQPTPHTLGAAHPPSQCADALASCNWLCWLPHTSTRPRLLPHVARTIPLHGTSHRQTQSSLPKPHVMVYSTRYMNFPESQGKNKMGTGTSLPRMDNYLAHFQPGAAARDVTAWRTRSVLCCTAEICHSQ